jgi:hypothetical protein
MMGPEALERIAARCAELDGLEEQLVKQLSEVRAERDELAAAERVWRDQRFADMAGGNDISATIVRRRRATLIALLDARAPLLDRALKKIAKRGGELVLIDGTPIPTQRRAPAHARRMRCRGRRTSCRHDLQSGALACYPRDLLQ